MPLALTEKLALKLAITDGPAGWVVMVGAEGAVNLSRITGDDPVHREGIAALVDVGDFAALDREALPVDDGALGEVVDVQPRGVHPLEIDVAGDHIRPLRIRAHPHRVKDETRGERHQNQDLKQQVPAERRSNGFHGFEKRRLARKERTLSHAIILRV